MDTNNAKPPTDRARILLTASLETRYGREIFHGIIGYARQHTNWQLLCREIIKVSQIRAGALDGMISLSAAPSIRRFARGADMPAVLIGSPNIESGISSVCVDERGIGELAAEHFVGLGLKHFAFISHGKWPFVADRRKYFMEAIERRGYGPVHEHSGVLDDDRRRNDYERNLQQMIAALPRPCGLLAANDSLGVLVVSICRNLGLRVPEDIAIVGVDDDELACELSEVPLSSVSQPLTAIGYEAARLLHQHLLYPDKPPTQVSLPPLRVVARASSDLIALDDADVVAALRLINERATDSIDVSWLVRQLPVARRSLERRFKAAVGRTILEQIHHVRFQKAKELLAESDLELELVARRSGFANARWMADKFRQEMQVSPHRFRKQFRINA